MQVFVQERNGCQHVLYFSAVSARVHIHSPAHRAGNAEGKFQPGQAFLLGGVAKSGKHHASRGQHLGAAIRLGLHGKAGVEPRQADNRPAEPCIRKQRVGTVAQQIGADLILAAQFQNTGQMRYRGGHTKKVCIAANAERCMPPQGFIKADRQVFCLQS